MYAIEITDSQNYLSIDHQELEAVARCVLQAEQVAGAELSLAVVDNPTIRALNRQYLGHDYDTDVLSFLLDCEPADHAGADAGATAAVPRGRGQRIEGEVVVSAEMARQSAGDFSWSPRQELLLYVIHGILHLTGYDDLSDPERQQMRAREDDMLRLCGLPAADRDASGERSPIHCGEEPASVDDEGDRPAKIPDRKPAAAQLGPPQLHQEGA